jgi:light-regulated signal transduction histidine kinase (bacteriophytochrome)
MSSAAPARSSLSSAAYHAEFVDCDQALALAALDLAEQLDANGVILTFDPLPTALNQSAPIVDVFKAFLASAIKGRTANRLRIHVWAHAAEGGYVICVKDNAGGIDPSVLNAPCSDFGDCWSPTALASARSAVERAGGRLWCDSVVNFGSTFCFTLPAVML